MTHSELCKLALNWLKRPASRGGHGCKVAIDECSTGWDGEIPDALGYRFAGNAMDGTVLVECKVSRSDFLADKNKPHRHTRGVGNWRYYMAPEGIISPAELPDRWGLVEVNSRGHLKTVVGAFSDSNYSLQQSRLVDMRHDSDTTREFFLVVRMFERVAEPEKIIDLTKERNRLAFRTAELANTLRMSPAMRIPCVKTRDSGPGELPAVPDRARHRHRGRLRAVQGLVTAPAVDLQQPGRRYVSKH